MRRPFRFALVICVLALLAAACGGDDAGSDPESVLAELAATGNAGDVDAVMDLYAADAVVLNHPLDDDGVATGHAEIRAIEEQSAPLQGSGAGFATFNVVVAGSNAEFDSSFSYAADGTTGYDGCAGNLFNSLSLEDGKIVLIEWGPNSAIHCPIEPLVPTTTGA